MHSFYHILINIVSRSGIRLVSLFLIVSRNCKNRAARVITGRKNEHGQSELALNELNFKTLKERRTKFIASLMYKITYGLAPKKLIDIFQKTLSQNYNLRGSTTKLYLPKPKTEYLKKGLSYRGAIVEWPLGRAEEYIISQSL